MFVVAGKYPLREDYFIERADLDVESPLHIKISGLMAVARKYAVHEHQRIQENPEAESQGGYDFNRMPPSLMTRPVSSQVAAVNRLSSAKDQENDNLLEELQKDLPVTESQAFQEIDMITKPKEI